MLFRSEQIVDNFHYVVNPLSPTGFDFTYGMGIKSPFTQEAFMIQKMVVAVLLACTAGSVPAWSAEKPNRTVYVTHYQDPVLKQLDEAREAAKTTLVQAGKALRKQQEEAEKNVVKMDLQTDISGVFPPAGPSEFKQAFHFPPQAQFATNTCWSFSTTSFYESEIFRLSGKKIKLSEMFTVYWEYVEKVRRFVRERGNWLSVYALCSASCRPWRGKRWLT